MAALRQSEAAQMRSDAKGCEGLHPPALLFATRSPVQDDDTTARTKMRLEADSARFQRLWLNRAAP
jgi:hypothetical protein